MPARSAAFEVIAVIAGAIIGSLVLAFLTWLFADGAFFTLLSSPGRFVLSLVVVALFAVLYHTTAKTPAALLSVAIGTLLPAIILRFGFDTLIGWPLLILLCLCFAVAALLTYRFVHANAALRQAVVEPTDRP